MDKDKNICEDPEVRASFAKRLQQAVIEKGLSPEVIAKEMTSNNRPISPQLIRTYMKESGSSPSILRVFWFADYFGKPMDWFFGREVIEPQTQLIDESVEQAAARYGFSIIKRIEPSLSGGPGSEVLEDGDSEDHYAFHTEYLKRKGNIDSLRLAIVEGDSMHPNLKDGDLVLFDKSITHPRDGRIMVVGMGNTLSIKRIRKTPSGLDLVSDNAVNNPPIPIDFNRDHSFKIFGLALWRCGDV